MTCIDIREHIIMLSSIKTKRRDQRKFEFTIKKNHCSKTIHPSIYSSTVKILVKISLSTGESFHRSRERFPEIGGVPSVKLILKGLVCNGHNRYYEHESGREGEGFNPPTAVDEGRRGMNLRLSCWRSYEFGCAWCAIILRRTFS